MEKSFATVSENEAREIPFPYVYIQNDGSHRELEENEKLYLQKKFHLVDGNRPYVKMYGEQRTADGKLNGFCKRTNLKKKKQWWQFWLD